MAGAALRGMGKVLAKHLRKVPVLGKHVKKARGTPTKAGLVARRAALRGETKKGEAIPEFIKKRPVTSVGIAGVALGAAQYRRKKLYEAKDKQKKKLEKSVEEHKKKTKEQKEKAKD